MRGRVLRAMKQTMFVISRELSATDDSTEIFEVLGSVGNVSKEKIRYASLDHELTFITIIELSRYYWSKNQMYLYGSCYSTKSLQAHLDGIAQGLSCSM